jgi:hypothetical protein
VELRRLCNRFSYFFFQFCDEATWFLSENKIKVDKLQLFKTNFKIIMVILPAQIAPVAASCRQSKDILYIPFSVAAKPLSLYRVPKIYLKKIR